MLLVEHRRSVKTLENSFYVVNPRVPGRMQLFIHRSKRSEIDCHSCRDAWPLDVLGLFQEEKELAAAFISISEATSSASI